MEMAAPRTRREMAERYEAGATYQEIGDEFGVSLQKVWRLLEGEVTSRPKAPRRRCTVPNWKRDTHAGWEANVVSLLREIKLQGRLVFAEAWDAAMREVPPPQRLLASASGALFDEDGMAEVDHVEFFRRACEDAWHGRRDVLRGFSVAMLAGAEDQSGFAIVASRRAA